LKKRKKKKEGEKKKREGMTDDVITETGKLRYFANFNLTDPRRKGEKKGGGGKESCSKGLVGPSKRILSPERGKEGKREKRRGGEGKKRGVGGDRMLVSPLRFPVLLFTRRGGGKGKGEKGRKEGKKDPK